MGFDMGYMMMVMLPGMVLSGLASMMVKNTFKKYETVGTQKNMTGAEAAQLMLERAGVTDCRIEPIAGRLSDHYDPRDKTLRYQSLFTTLVQYQQSGLPVTRPDTLCNTLPATSFCRCALNWCP